MMVAEARVQEDPLNAVIARVSKAKSAVRRRMFAPVQ
jgi:hypothetical protein